MMLHALRLTSLIALLLPALALGADAPADAGQKAKLEFVRSGAAVALIKARIEVNGKRIGELGRGETASASVDAGKVAVKVDAAYTPGQLMFSFVAEKGAEYRFELFDSVDKFGIEQLVGAPPKAAGAQVLESSGMMKARLTAAKLPPPAEPASAPAATPVATPAAASAPSAPAEKPVPPAAAAAFPEKAPESAAQKPAAPPAATAEKAPEGAASSVEEQLRTLKRLHDQGLVSNEIYLERQRKILEGLK